MHLRSFVHIFVGMAIMTALALYTPARAADIVTIASFDGTTTYGEYPNVGVTLDSSGNLYGATQFGGFPELRYGL